VQNELVRVLITLRQQTASNASYNFSIIKKLNPFYPIFLLLFLFIFFYKPTKKKTLTFIEKKKNKKIFLQYFFCLLLNKKKKQIGRKTGEAIEPQ